TVSIDNQQGAYQATRYLLDMGHINIAHITGILSHEDAIERRDGYRQAMAEAGLDLLEIEGDYTEHSGLMCVTRLLASAKPFTAIFAANDQLAMGARL